MRLERVPPTTDRFIIVNADDFGISPGVNRGIVESHRRGITSSTSLMANQPWAAEAVELWRSCPALGLGLHVTLTSGRPCSPADSIPTLVQPDGRFPILGVLLARASAGALRSDELRLEIAAQAERAVTLGARLDHMDSHHHVHAHPRIGREVLAVALDYGIRALRCPTERPRATAPRNLARTLAVSLAARWMRAAAARAGLPTSDHFAGIGLGYGFGASELACELARLAPGVTELMVHPGFPDEMLARATSFVNGRDRELESLVDPRQRAALRDVGARLRAW